MLGFPARSTIPAATPQPFFILNTCINKKVIFGFLTLIYPSSRLNVDLSSFLGEGGPPDTTFIEDAVLELLKTRRILKCSYPYGFFLEPKSTKKEIYELMQVSILFAWKRQTFSTACLIWAVRGVKLSTS